MKHPQPTLVSFTVDLPNHYRAQEILKFHARDPEQLAERITANSITKAIMLSGHPTFIHIEFGPQVAHCTFETDDQLLSLPRAQHIAKGLLGLVIDVDSFERKCKADKLLGELISRQKGLRIPQTATPFEALTWAIIGQQINVRFAVQLRHSLIRLANLTNPPRHSSGLICYPDATLVSRLSANQLSAHKFSRAKAETLLRVSQLVLNGTLPLGDWQQAGHEPICIENALLEVKGIGPWTAHYTLMRGFGYTDCSLHGDVAVRNALAKINRNDVAPTPTAAEAMLAQYAPYRSLVAAHLWASLKVTE